MATGAVSHGETLVVNLHGALLRTVEHLEIGYHITLYVSFTGKSASGRVVSAGQECAFHFGIALDLPENILGISLSPEIGIPGRPTPGNSWARVYRPAKLITAISFLRSSSRAQCGSVFLL